MQIGNLEKNVQNLKVQLAGAHGNHKEAMDQVINVVFQCWLSLLFGDAVALHVIVVNWFKLCGFPLFFSWLKDLRV